MDGVCMSDADISNASRAVIIAELRLQVVRLMALFGCRYGVGETSLGKLHHAVDMRL